MEEVFKYLKDIQTIGHVLIAITALFTFVFIALVYKGNTSSRQKLQNSLLLIISAVVIVFSVSHFFLGNARPSKIKIKGIVYVNGKLGDGVRVKIPGTDKSIQTSALGKFELEVYKEDLDSLNAIIFEYAPLNIDTVIRRSQNELSGDYLLIGKPANKIVVKKPLSGPPTFNFLKFNSPLFSAKFLAMGYKQQPNSPDYSIEIAYSGKIEKIEGVELYRYRGGNLIIRINDKVCHTFNNIQIDNTFPQGNSLQFVESELSDAVEKIMSKSTDQIFEKILICLK